MGRNAGVFLLVARGHGGETVIGVGDRLNHGGKSLAAAAVRDVVHLLLGHIENVRGRARLLKAGVGDLAGDIDHTAQQRFLLDDVSIFFDVCGGGNELRHLHNITFSLSFVKLALGLHPVEQRHHVDTLTAAEHREHCAVDRDVLRDVEVGRLEQNCNFI